MGNYAFLRTKKIHGVFNDPAKYETKNQNKYTLLQEEGMDVEVGIPTHLDGENLYTIYLAEEVGSVQGRGNKWRYITLDGTVSEANHRTRRDAAMAVAENYLRTKKEAK